MFTPATYVEYFAEIYRKEDEVITALRTVRDGTSDERLRQALTEELGRKSRQMDWIEDLLMVLIKSVEVKKVPEKVPAPDDEEIVVDLLQK